MSRQAAFAIGFAAIGAVLLYVDWGSRHRARVIDGDTIVMDGRHLRLAGIDAPELRQQCRNAEGRWYACGLIAKDALETLIHPPADLECRDIGERSYNRIVAICTVDGIDVGATMVWLGHAIDLVHFSHGRYAAQQEAARTAHRGIWSGSFVDPYEFRHQAKKDKVP